MQAGLADTIIGKESTIQEQIAGSLLQERLLSMLASAFGTLALVLACIGLYGLLSYTVIRRTREFGIRLAIGAKQTTVLWLVLRETLGLVSRVWQLGFSSCWPSGAT